MAICFDADRELNFKHYIMYKTIKELLSKAHKPKAGTSVIYEHRLYTLKKIDLKTDTAWIIKEIGTKAIKVPTSECLVEIPALELNCRIWPIDLKDINTFDALEVSPVACWEDEQNPAQLICEICEPSEANFYSVYAHVKGKGVQCFADCDTEETALGLAKLIETLIAKAVTPDQFHFRYI